MSGSLITISTVPLAFDALREALLYHCEDQEAETMIIVLRNRYKRIASDAHILAMVMDLIVPKERYCAVSWLLDGRPVSAVATAALEKDKNAQGLPDGRRQELLRNLVFWISGITTETFNAFLCHPLVWWKFIGFEKWLNLATVASRVFSLIASSAGAERSFKVR